MKIETFEIQEVLLVGYRPHTDLGAGIGLKIGRDDLTPNKAEYLRTHLGRRFALVLVPIGDDEKPVIEEPAVILKPRNRIAQLGGMRRNEAPYQMVLMNYFGGRDGYEFVHNTLNPVDRRKMIAAIQHQFCGVESLAEIQPNTPAALKFDLLETLYEADKQGLPPPNMDAPNVFQLIGREKR